jgi:hypothetical protein
MEIEADYDADFYQEVTVHFGIWLRQNIKRID